MQNTTASAASDTSESLIMHLFLYGTTISPMPTNSALAELVLVQGDHERQKMEGYLAWARGLEGNLPSDHPYKSAAPTE